MTASSGAIASRKASIDNQAKQQVAKYGNADLDAAFADYLKNNADYGQVWKSKYNGAGYADKNVQNFTNDQKQSLQNYLDTTFGDLGGSNTWLKNYYTNDYGQNSVNNFLDTQYNAALDQIDRAKNRGLLSDTGYQSALNNLGTQYNSGFANVNSINQGLIDDYKNELTEAAQGYMTDLANYDLSKYSTMTKDNWANNLQDIYNNQQNMYQSNFDNATSGMNLFDTSDIINTARTEQGVNNAQTDELMDTLDETSRQKNKKTGLGNVGVF